MSEFTQEQQTEIVGDAMNLTAAIECEEAELKALRGQRFRDRPAAPQRSTAKSVQIQPEYPPVPKAVYSFGTHIKSFFSKKKKLFIGIGIGIGALFLLAIIISIIASIAIDGNDGGLFGTFFVGGLLAFVIPQLFMAVGIIFIVLFATYWGAKKSLNQQLAQSPEYQNAIREADALAAQKQKEADERTRAEQARLDAEYEAAVKQYETETVPAYERERDQWEMIHKHKITAIENDKQINSETLQTLYDTTRLVSATYRELWILRWLYTDMSSSDHDIRYATELLDRDRQRLVTQESGRMVREAVEAMNHDLREGFRAVYAAIEEGNDLQAETLNVMEQTKRLVSKTRRDMNIGNLVGAVQRKKTQGLLEGIGSQLSDLKKS